MHDASTHIGLADGRWNLAAQESLGLTPANAVRAREKTACELGLLPTALLRRVSSLDSGENSAESESSYKLPSFGTERGQRQTESGIAL